MALGVAKGALEAFSDIAQNKIPMLASKSLAHRPIAQFRMGEAEAMYRSCRSWLMEAMEAVEDELREGADFPGAKTTQDARLACVHASNECMKVVDLLHNTAGTTGMRMYSPLERKLRDAHAAATHRWVAHPLYQDLGSYYSVMNPTQNSLAVMEHPPLSKKNFLTRKPSLCLGFLG